MGKVIVLVGWIFTFFSQPLQSQTYTGLFTRKSVNKDGIHQITTYCTKREGTRVVDCLYIFNLQEGLLQVNSPEKVNTVRIRDFRVGYTNGGIRKFIAEDSKRRCAVFVKDKKIIQIQYQCAPNTYFVIYHN